MSFAKNYLKQYNADSAWNSLGAVGSTSAWEGSTKRQSIPDYNNIVARFAGFSKRGSGGANPYAPAAPSRYGEMGSGALNAINKLVGATPENLTQRINNYKDLVLAGKYFDSLRMSDLF